MSTTSVKEIVALDSTREGRANHPPNELGDQRSVGRRAERHHHLSARTIPTCGKCHFEEHDPYGRVGVDVRRSKLAQGAAIQVEWRILLKAMSDFGVREWPDRSLNDPQSRRQIGPR
jgi:hypothetical protein